MSVKSKKVHSFAQDYTTQGKGRNKLRCLILFSIKPKPRRKNEHYFVKKYNQCTFIIGSLWCDSKSLLTYTGPVKQGDFQRGIRTMQLRARTLDHTARIKIPALLLTNCGTSRKSLTFLCLSFITGNIDTEITTSQECCEDQICKWNHVKLPFLQVKNGQ